MLLLSQQTTAMSPSPFPSQVVNQVLEKTSSGCFCGNDTLMQVTLTSLPFGGIGKSRAPSLPTWGRRNWASSLSHQKPFALLCWG